MKRSIIICTLILSILGAWTVSTLVVEASTVPLVNPIGGDADNPEGTVSTVQGVLGLAIAAALTVAGSLALAAFVYGSFVWLTSAGKSDKIQQGLRTMTYAAIGLFVIFGAYGILGQVLDILTGGDTPAPTESSEEEPTGGSLLPSGSVCTTDEQCLSGNCLLEGPLVEPVCE